MNIKSLAHVCIKTTDLDATTDFYCGALGMKKVFNFTKKEKIIGFYMKASNDTFIEVFRADEVQKMDKQTLAHFCLQADSLEPLRKALLDRGYSAVTTEIKMGVDNTLQFWTKDPNGMPVEFQQYTDQSAQITGKDVEVTWGS